MIIDYTNTTDFDCRLCVEINDFKNSLFAHTYPGLLSYNSFFETDHLQLMLPVGPFCEGHILIASKTHLWSFGHADKIVISQLASLIDSLTIFLEAHYGRIIAFEHGPMSKVRRGGCCLEHAHINLMPIPESLQLHKSASKFLPFFPIKIAQLSDFVERDDPYLFFSCKKEGSYAASAPEGTAQFFRKLVSSEINEDKWDWRDNDNVDFIIRMTKVLTDFT